MENKKIKLDNQKLMIQRLKPNNVQDRIATFNAEAKMIEKQIYI